MNYKMNNLVGTKRDPRRTRRTAFTDKPVYIGTRHVPPAKSVIIDDVLYVNYRSQIDEYLKYGMLEVDRVSAKDFSLMQATLNGVVSVVTGVDFALGDDYTVTQVFEFVEPEQTSYVEDAPEVTITQVELAVEPVAEPVDEVVIYDRALQEDAQSKRKSRRRKNTED